METFESVGKNIRNFRLFRNMTQKDLAAKLGVSSNALAYWEKGYHSFDVKIMQNICKILDVTPNQLCGWEESKELNEFLKKQDELLKKKNQLQSEISKMYMAYSELNKEIKKKKGENEI